MVRKCVEAKIFLIVALVCGLLLVFLIPPLQSADEPVHFANAYAMSRGDIFPDNKDNKAFGHEMPEAVYNCIYRLTNHAATLYKGTGLYDDEKRSTIYSVVSSEEVDYVVKSIKEIDKHAFVNVLKTEQLLGSFYRHPNR